MDAKRPPENLRAALSRRWVPLMIQSGRVKSLFRCSELVLPEATVYFRVLAKKFFSTTAIFVLDVELECDDLRLRSKFQVGRDQGLCAWHILHQFRGDYLLFRPSLPSLHPTQFSIATIGIVSEDLHRKATS